jgi:hypothetical protein
MVCYRIAGQEFYFSCPVPELNSFEIPVTEQLETLQTIPVAVGLICRATGWIGEEQREVECWSAPPGLVLRVAGGSDFYLSKEGRAIVPVAGKQSNSDQNRTASLSFLSGLDREILAGPALVLALALRGIWCLHASAALFNGNLIVFLGESGQGKSTLAAFLAADNPGWRLASDDILPVTLGPGGVTTWPRFPQLKLPGEAQPGVFLPEQLPVSKVCVLTDSMGSENPGLQPLAAGQSVQAYLGNTAGARLFSPELLAMHLAFCTQAAGLVPVTILPYAHEWDALPLARQLLERLY